MIETGVIAVVVAVVVVLLLGAVSRAKAVACPRGGANVDLELRPCLALDRPVVLLPLRECLARMADLQLNARLRVPAGVFALEEVPEETLLQAQAVVGVEMRPMGVAMHLQPLLRRCRRQE